jgi:molybdopterin/thiamine biosynthesis adenylyltransferase
MKIKLRESAYILRENSGIYQVVFTSTRRIKRFRVDKLTEAVIAAVNDVKDSELLLQSLESNYPREDILSCVKTLMQHGIILEDTGLSVDERYRKQVAFIEELTTSTEETQRLQNRLENSVITVFGIGGIGSWIVNGLYQIGIGEIRIVDPDIVERSNLNRQLYFFLSDIGKFKVDVMKAKMPDAHIVPYRRTVSPSEDLEEVVRGADFMVNCADSPSVQETTREIDKYARAMDIPYLVTGGYNLHLGMVGPIIVPGKTACFNCFMEYQKKNDALSNLEKIKDIEQTGNLGPIAGVVANLQVMDIFKFLIGKGSVNFNRFAEIDFMNLSLEWREFSRQEDCRVCNP